MLLPSQHPQQFANLGGGELKQLLSVQDELLGGKSRAGNDYDYDDDHHDDNDYGDDNVKD